jgi:hypothetical protein
VSDPRRTLLKLARAACERGDALGALALLVAHDEMPDEREAAPGGEQPYAESYARFAARVGKCARTVREMIRDGRIPSSAVVGTGNGRRVLVREALDALKPGVAKCGEDAGRAYVERRRRLRVVGEGASGERKS